MFSLWLQVNFHPRFERDFTARNLESTDRTEYDESKIEATCVIPPIRGIGTDNRHEST